MTSFSVVPVDRVDVSYAPWPWPFALERRAEIDAHFAKLRLTNPALWNGRVLMLRDHAIADGIFRGRCFETGFADLLAWLDWDFPSDSVKNFFAMGALRGSDGGFVLGEMAGHTANAGRIYFPAGTPDLEDVSGDTVDLAASVLREVAEETGLTPADFRRVPGWFAVSAGPVLPLMQLLEAPVPAGELAERIRGYLARQAQPEFAAIHIVRGPADLTPAVRPFVGAFLRHIWR